MINHGYDVKRTDNETVNRNLSAIKQALDVIVSGIVNPIWLTFASLGLNGVGSLQLVPPKLPNGTTPLYRALVGMRLVGCLDLTSNQSLQTSFEQVLTANDAIKQISSVNLSANTLVFILQG